MHGSTIKNNEYTGSGSFASATGVLVFGGCGDPLSTNDVVSGNTISNNDAGVVLANYSADPNCVASATTVTNDTVKNNTISKNDGLTNQSPFTDWQNTAYTGYQVGIGDTGNGDQISDNKITGTVTGGNDTAFGPQHQAGGNFLDCIDLITYPPIGAKLSGNTCDGSAELSGHAGVDEVPVGRQRRRGQFRQCRIVRWSRSADLSCPARRASARSLPAPRRGSRRSAGRETDGRRRRRAERGGSPRQAASRA